MAKWSSFIFAGVFAAAALSGCQSHGPSNENVHSASVSSSSPPASNAGHATADATKADEYPGLKGIVVHTANGYTAAFEKKSDFKPFASLLTDINNLYWIAPRGGAGINPDDRQANKSSKVRAIVESSKSKPDYKGDFIRLEYNPQVPEKGENTLGHQDMLIYQDTNHEENADLAIQDPKQADQWLIYILPGYGQWLSRELEIINRVYFGL
ncbi:hypothetical protein [Paenibacillus humicola]|uniref:hypothetical protein n=1 Tax=Paenibacillus humicola TaxID=3110540 RepID=UPI00237A65FA|nr:hypothetical protein [Paenibacillus humicola]